MDEDGSYLYYHFNSNGSTTVVTGDDGKIVHAFTYGTYGELLSGNTHGILFLYNGRYGVATDSSGLYYMRARYYNPDSTTVYTYDRNGNLLKQTNGTDTNLYTYDGYNRLISAKVTKDGKTTTDIYTYDVEGNRLTKTTNGTLTKYIVDSNGLSQVLAELDSNNKASVFMRGL